MYSCIVQRVIITCQNLKSLYLTDGLSRIVAIIINALVAVKSKKLKPLLRKILLAIMIRNDYYKLETYIEKCIYSIRLLLKHV